MVNFKKVVVHCSDTPNGALFTAAEIDEWHRARGWNGIGYHYVIEIDQLVFGRSILRRGAHTKGHNKDSIGICLMGRTEFNETQWTILKNLFFNIYDRFGIEAKDWHCHHEFNSLKTCPGFTAAELRGFLRGIDIQV